MAVDRTRPAVRRALLGAAAAVTCAVIIPIAADSSRPDAPAAYRAAVAGDHPAAALGSAAITGRDASRHSDFVVTNRAGRVIVRTRAVTPRGSLELWARPRAASTGAIALRVGHRRVPLRAALRPDTWSYVVATWQGREMHVSVDGVPADTVTDPSRRSVKRVPAALELRGVAQATDIRELRVYRQALSPHRVREHFAAGRPLFGRAAPQAGRSVAHAADALTASVRPSVSGTTTDGQTLSATTGTWDGIAPIDYVRQWERCDTDGEDCTDIDGADGATYDLTELDVGATLRVRVTATDATSATGAATSDQTAVVAPSPPATATLPAVTGDPVEGLTLDADLGPWTGTPPITFSTEWLRCTAGGTGCESFANPGGAHYVVKHSDIGSTFRIRVSAWSAGGYAVKTSRATAVVTSAEAPAATAELPELDGTEVDDHERIAATTIGTFTGSAPMTFAHRWEYCEDDRTPRCQQVSGGEWSSSGTDAESGTVDAAYGTSLRLVVTATNIAGSAQMVSAEVPIIPVAITLADELDLSGQWVGGTVNAEKFVAGAHIYGGAAYPTNDASYPLTSAGAVLRCDDTTIGSCSPISGTSSDDLGGLSYTVTAGDVGHYLRIRKTVTNAAGSETAYTRAQLVDHSAPMWIGSNDAPATDGYTPVSGGLALSKGDGNDDDGLQVFDTVRWTPGQWIGDDMEDDSGVLVSWRRADSGLSLGSGRTWTIDTKEWDDGDSLAVREYATNTYGSGLHLEDTGRQTVRSSPLTPVSLTAPTMLAASVPKEGDILDGAEGTWEDGHEDPDSVIRTLLRCDASGDDCEVINQPRLGSEAIGHRYKWRETASNGAGSVTVESPLTKHPAWVSNYRRALWEDRPWWAFPEYSPDWIWQLGGGHEDWMGIDLGMSGRGAAFDRADGWSLEAIVTSATLPTIGGASDHADPMILYVGRDDLTAFADPSHATAHPGRGYGFGLRDDGCLYGSFGFRREFSLGSCVSSLGITSPQHFVMTYDYSDVRFYVDGTLTATVAMTDPFPTELLPGSPFESGVVSRGYRPRRNNTPTATSETTNILSGSIPQAATYQGVLTADRIAAHGTAVADDTSLAQLVNTVAPAISGTAREGRLLTASAGTWTGATPIERAYQWQRCAANGTACVDIDEATETTYRATDADVGHALRVVVEATNEVGADSVTSAATAEIETGPPVVTVDPVITGDALDQHELTADDGTWAGTGPQTIARQWRRCDAAGAACTDISGADGVHYTVDLADVGGTLRLAVTATSAEGSTTATTDATDVVAVSAPEAADGPSITGTAKVGETLRRPRRHVDGDRAAHADASVVALRRRRRGL